MDKITNYMRATKRKAHESVGKPAASSSSGKPVVAKSLAAPSVKKAKTDAVIVDADGEIYDHGVHVPQFIFHAVEYARKGHGHKVSPATQTLVDYVQKHYEIPVDLETNHKYGPHSGVTYESRLLRAYKFKQLLSKSKTPPAAICLTCTKVGHVDRECPDGF